MKHLLDVNVLIAAIWSDHPQYAVADAWLSGKSIVLCPITELGFLRISTHKKAMGAPMNRARNALAAFIADTQATHIPADLGALDSRPDSSEKVTDLYLADLAASHGLKLATFDKGIIHKAVEVIS